MSPRTTSSSSTPTYNSVAGLLAQLVGLDDVVDLQVTVRAERETALEALAPPARVVLEPPQRADGQVLLDDHAVAHEPRLGVAPDLAGQHHATRDRADLRGLEHLAHL